MISYTKKTINIEDSNELLNFLKEIHKKYPNSDTFSSKTPIFIETHKHDDDESRLFLTGNAKFVINGEEILCEKGDYIEIYESVLHSFEYSSKEELKVLRFFSKSSLWSATYC